MKSGSTKLLCSTGTPNGSYYFGNFSPSGARLLYGFHSLMFAWLKRIEVKTGKNTPILDSLQVLGGRFSPDGKRLVFSTWGESRERLGLARANGTGTKSLKTWKKFAVADYRSACGFSRSGKTLLVGGPKGLYTMTVAGKKTRLIVNGATDGDWY